MAEPRIAVLVRTYFWDEFAFRSALQIWRNCEGLDFYVLADETHTGPLNVLPFPKLGHATADFERLGLPCVAPETMAPLWWNCDYSLYDALLKLPEYDCYCIVEIDIAVNLQLRPMIERAIAAGHDCVVPFGLRAMHPGWVWSSSCVSLPYAKKAWAPLSLLLISRGAAEYLLSERQQLGRRYALGTLSEWPICEGFFGSAMLDAGYSVGSAHEFADLSCFGSNSIYLETDPRTRVPGSLCHSVVDVGRFWTKFVERGLVTLRRGHDYQELRLARDGLAATGCTSFQGWRLSLAPGNLALDRPARQSSLSRWSVKTPPGHLDPTAHDARGATCGVLTGGFGFHTGLEEHPWWQVDLEQIRAVNEVRIFNSLTGRERARRLSVYVSADEAQWSLVYRKDDDRVFAGVDDPLSCKLQQPVSARFVRIVLDGLAPLHLDAVEVYGPAEPAPQS